MKINEKISLVLVALILVFTLVSCNKDSQTPEDLGNNVEQVTPDSPQEGPVVDATGDIDVEPVVEVDEKTDRDPIDEMIDSSDYIAKIKLIKKGQDTTELKVLDSIKGNVSSSDLPAMDAVELNRAYVVFLKDVDGSVILTDEAEGVILLEGDNHELFEKINKKVHNN